MKKFLKIFLIILVFVILIVLLYVLVTFPPIMRGMAAKTMCSCVFVSARSPESVLGKELQVFPGLSEVPLQIDYSDSTVTASMLWQDRNAIYRKGLGCTLLAEADENAVKNQRFITYRRPAIMTDTIPWPAGDRNASSKDLTINREAIERIVNGAFIEKDPGKPAYTHAVVILYNGRI